MLIGFHVCFPNCSFFVALLTISGSTVPPLAVHVPLSTPGAVKMQKQSRLVLFKEFHIMQSSLSECFFAVFFVCFNNKHIIQLVNEAVKSWLVLLASLHSKQAWIKTALLMIESKRQIILGSTSTQQSAMLNLCYQASLMTLGRGSWSGCDTWVANTIVTGCVEVIY